MTTFGVSFDEIKCPSCGTSIPVSEALYHQISNEARHELRAEYTEKQRHIEARDQELKRKEAELSQVIEERVKGTIAEIKREAVTKANEAIGNELADLRNQAEENGRKLAEASRVELDLRKEKRDLVEKSKSLELEVARRIDAERGQIRDEAVRQIQDEYRLKDAEREKKLQDALKVNDNLRRKLEQGSQQSQGEVLELRLEELLKGYFLMDVIESVPKGINGADLIQRVRNAAGQPCGTIIWETKRTKQWSDGWLQKLKDDQRAIKAELAVIVSEALPKECTHFAQVNGVWVTNPECAINLAIALRFQLIEVAMVRLATVGKNEKMEVLYDYLSGTAFRQHVEAIVESFISMQKDLMDERRNTERLWAKREKLLQKVISNTSGMYGELQALIGSSLQSIPALTSSSVTEENEDPVLSLTAT